MVLCFQLTNAQDCDKIDSYAHPINFKPLVYHASKINSAIVLDGKLDETSWLTAEPTSDFVDIEGSLKAQPERRTNVKMLWDDEYLYIGAYMEEDHIWYTLTERDAIIYNDDDFEVFIDADGDGHNYHEIEINANNTILDLWMLYPYGIDKKDYYIIDWDGKGLKTAVHIEGTANDPSDIDHFWSVEMIIPLKMVGGKRDFWRIDFSRVDWLMDVKNGKYVKQKQKRKNKPERNWVWSPTGYVNMHKPETWGYLFFDPDFEISEEELFKWEMWKVYYKAKSLKKKQGKYPENLKCISDDPRINISASDYNFDIIGKFKGRTWTIDKYAFIRRN